MYSEIYLMETFHQSSFSKFGCYFLHYRCYMSSCKKKMNNTRMFYLLMALQLFNISNYFDSFLPVLSMYKI